MKLSVILTLSCLAVLSFANDELPLAEVCNPQECQLPDCRCSTPEIPGGLDARDTPQFVLLTFDDGVNVLNIETYREILYNRVNSNGCSAGTTFFVNHEYTNYQLVNELYNNGYEIALHSMSHQNNQLYWRDATYEDMVREFGDQKKQMAHFANIPEDEIKGVRIPFLQMTGNASFQVIADHDLEYDATWPTIIYMNPGLWPYTLDYASTQDCVVPPCPTASIPKAWIQPMVSWQDLNGVPCSMVDSCFNIPDVNDGDAWFEFIVTNFERHYLNNRAPFGFFVHEWFVNTNPGVKDGLIRFMNLVNELQDAFMVNTKEVIAWAKNPVPLDEYVSQSCPQPAAAPCPALTCPVEAEHNGNTYWLAVCSACPQVYPWLGNPLGEDLSEQS